MVAKRITDLTELTTPAAGDFIEVVDVSDTTQNAAGSSFKVQVGNIGGNPLDANSIIAARIFSR